MSDIYITEYARQPRDAEGRLLPVGEEPPLAYQKVASSGTTAQSAAFNAKTHFVRINASAAVVLNFGSDPTAADTDGNGERMSADQTEFFGVQPGHKVAVIDST